ncbi:transmembrane efflux protein [Alloactinosynnema sp. L-07]|uniref:MFS transporter n=1 Tax=Alloactinosynnema sp. L-07 TaxID=1653480 RepID=UPI00065EFD7A|nr:MFS transporter [Alloactinosynnema sp. L-07]CRK57471.1 transmembrane efflux protein [Alloactinosynnema sp. L-07]
MLTRVHATIALIAFLTAADNTVVAAAAPSVAAEWGLGVTATQGVTVAYLLPFAGLLLAAGPIVDRFGERAVLRSGLLAFAVGTVVAASAVGYWQLVAGRVVQGAAAALLVPATLSLVRTRLAAADRARAAAVWTIALALALAAGPAIGGLVAEHLHWTWVFWGTLPVLVAASAVLPEARHAAARPTDVIGLGLAALVMLLATGALMVLADGGILAVPLGAGGVLVALWFVARERQSPAPVVPAELARDKVFRSVLVVQALWGLGVTGVCVVTPLVHQRWLGLGPADAALPLVAVAASLILTAPWVPAVLSAVGEAKAVSGGLIVVALGLVEVAAVNEIALLWPRLPGLILIGVGSAFTVPLTTLALEVAGERLAGAASGLLSAAREFAGALGVAAVAVFVGGTAGELANGYTAALVAAAVLQVGAALIAARVGETARVRTVR